MTSVEVLTPCEQAAKRLLDAKTRERREQEAQRLLECLWVDSDVEGLDALVVSDAADAADLFAWALSELGAGSARFAPHLVSLLGHERRTARFWAVDACLAASELIEGSLLAAAVDLVTDADEAVRSQVLRLLNNVAIDALDAAVPHLTAPSVAEACSWLASECRRGMDAGGVVDKLKSPDGIWRRVAAVVAVRSLAVDRAPADFAVGLNDPDIHRFARRAMNQP